jgi:hypothetical protein
VSLLAIDPAHADPGSACALFGAGRGGLSAVWFFKPFRATHHYGFTGTTCIETVVIEKPQVDDRTVGIPLKDVINLSYAAGRVLGFYTEAGARVKEYLPRQWKGSTPKPLHHLKLWGVLTEAEREVVGGADALAQIEAACERGGLARWSKPGVVYYGGWKGHNILDAVALGCFHLGRIGK